MPRVIRMRTYLNHPGKHHLARGVGSSVGTRNTVMKKTYDPTGKQNFDKNNRHKSTVNKTNKTKNNNKNKK